MRFQVCLMVKLVAFIKVKSIFFDYVRAYEIVKKVPHTEVRSWTSRKASIFFIASGEGEAGYKFCRG